MKNLSTRIVRAFVLVSMLASLSLAACGGEEGDFGAEEEQELAETEDALATWKCTYVGGDTGWVCKCVANCAF